MGRRDDASGRVDPKRIGSDQFKPRPFGAGYLDVETLLPFLVITNQDTIVHTFTASIRQGNGPEFTVTFQVAAGSSVSWPTLGTAGIKVDQAGSPSSCKAFYSDIAPAGFKSAAGSGATTVVHDFAGTSIEPNANNTFQMAGLGSALSLTPKISGIVRLEVTVQLRISTIANNFAEVKGAFGTGSAPALNAAAVGTASEILMQITSASEAQDLQVYGKAIITFSGLTLNTLYWFDLQALVTNTSDDSMTAYDASVQELPW